MQNRLDPSSTDVTLTLQDYRKQYCEFHNKASDFFDAENYNGAIEHYLQGIDTYTRASKRFKLADSDYRALIRLYIDLSDAYCHLFETALAEIAVDRAIQIFSCIENKSQKEKEIGDPRRNFQLFHQYFEETCSEPWYLQSVEFKAHKEVLHETHDDKQIFSGLNRLAIFEQNESKQANFVNGISFSLPALAPMTDDDYRAMAKSFMQQAQIVLGNIAMNDLAITAQDAIRAYQLVIDALNRIENKNRDDVQNLRGLQTSILVLQTSSPSLPSQTGMYSQSQPSQAIDRAVAQSQKEDDITMGIGRMTIRD
jgi:hypothetical protein